jgi:hypothetical protein
MPDTPACGARCPAVEKIDVVRDEDQREVGLFPKSAEMILHLQPREVTPTLLATPQKFLPPPTRGRSRRLVKSRTFSMVAAN